MGPHRQQVRTAPQRPVTLADRDVAARIGVLALFEGQVRSGEASPLSGPACGDQRRRRAYERTMDASSA
jgi:hypothetical protein